MNLTEIVRRLNHYAEHELPYDQTRELAAELARRHRQLVQLIGNDNAGRFTIAVQQLDAARKLAGMMQQRLDTCRTAVRDATARLR